MELNVLCVLPLGVHGQNVVATLNGVVKLSTSRLALAGLRLVLVPSSPSTHFAWAPNSQK